MVDVAANRSMLKWTLKERIARVLWAVVQPFFVLSPRIAWGWRRMLLRAFGAKIGRNAHIYPSARVTIPWNLSVGDEAAIGDRAIVYALGPIQIGARATISQNVHLCAGTHDWRDPKMPLVKTPLTIAEDSWVCADAFVGPGVAIGTGAIVGARAAVMKDVAANEIVGGNPAQVIGNRGR